ncbi:peptidase, putative [Bodo saltans]|uniref:Peptidase, putative n=1 Tax=Bodo saltans TaxID=75058 RepID=A0A0S4J9X5_BODSA|nr:peptidase, putative [Bodo saltans]|eukprot:CUG88276.1 peptidase, putative [Bodo saltans]
MKASSLFPQVVCSSVGCVASTAAKKSAGFAVSFVRKGTKFEVPDASFKGEVGQLYVDYAKETVTAGVGSESIGEIQRATHAVVSSARARKISALDFHLPDAHKANIGKEPSANSLFLHDASAKERNKPAIAQAVACSAVMGTYQYSRMKTSAADKTDAPALSIRSRGSKSDTAIEAGVVIGNAVNDARTLGNLRPDEGNPRFYEAWMRKNIAGMPNVHVRHVIRGRALKEHGLGLMHAVGRAAVHEPVLVVLEYRGDKRSDESIGLVGKGLTFDCGGMNVKPYGSMESMHQDMMGAAAVMATMRAVAKLKLPVNVVAVAAFAENAIGPDAYLPSTIIKSLNGKSVEILNTDAEGRLVLADALTFLQRKAKVTVKPTTVVDLATLTGAILIGLGTERAGLFANNAKLMNDLMISGARTNELLWPMPIGAEHTKAMKGGIADLINAAEGRSGGSCTAAAFLQEFIEKDVNWAHLDIAGTGMGKDKATPNQPAGTPGFGKKKSGSCTAAAFLQEFIEKDVSWAHLDIAGTGMGKDKATPNQPAGTPGFGVRLLVDLLQRRCKAFSL